MLARRPPRAAVAAKHEPPGPPVLAPNTVAELPAAQLSQAAAREAPSAAVAAPLDAAAPGQAAAANTAVLAGQPRELAPDDPQHPPQGLHHLTRHWLPNEVRGDVVLQRLGAPDIRTAELMIRNMGQRDLRDAFHRVYGAATQSFNNTWLRRKLAEALGVKAGGVSKARKRAGGARIQGRRSAPSSGGGGGGSTAAADASRQQARSGRGTAGSATGAAGGARSRPGSRATARAALAGAMAAEEARSAGEYNYEEEEEEEEEFWSDLSPPAAHARGATAAAVPPAAAAAVAAGAGGNDDGGMQRNGCKSATRDAQAAAVLHNFAGALVTAAEQLRTPTAPGLPAAPPLPALGKEQGWAVQQQPPMADDMHRWRHMWRQSHVGEGGKEWQLPVAQPSQSEPVPAVQPVVALMPQQPGSANLSIPSLLLHQYLQQCQQQLQQHQQVYPMPPLPPPPPQQQQQQQPSEASTMLPLFVGGGTISPRVLPISKSPPVVAATVAAATAAAPAASSTPAGATASLPAQVQRAQRVQQLWQPSQQDFMATAAAEAARQTAEAAAEAASASALPPIVGVGLRSEKVLAALQQLPPVQAGPWAALPASEAGSSEGQHMPLPKEQQQNGDGEHDAAASLQPTGAAKAALERQPSPVLPAGEGPQ